MKFAASRGALTAIGCALSLSFVPAVAAEFPAKPVTLVVPQGPGSGSDVTARLLATHMGSALGQTVVVDNRTGAGGIIAHQSVTRSPSDGYTLLFTSTAQLLVVPAINPAARYSLDDFVPVAPVLRASFAVLVANTPGAPKTVKELVDMLRVKPSAFASAGVGTMTHLGSEIFLRRAGVTATHVPYRGSGAALTDLMGGQVLFATDSLTASMPHIRSGKLRALAVTVDKREPSLPEVPTLAEAGLPGEPISVIGGIFAPKGTPRDVAEKLGKAAEVALRNPDLVARFAASETDVLRIGNAEFIGQLRKETPFWTNLVRQLDIKPE
ncbi:Bug family tripartite tricarboxylate transporter substrate binding protein [Piscinibacter sakaiensis]|uniref:Bug family tripartite tricarboxylate transporter substrate binding protein n=1 Tax=Piscinibacter sakaiensis TaxID=1547922 RepID=UPI003AAEA790